MWDQTGGDLGSSMAGGFFTGTPGGGSQATPGDGKKGGVQRAHNVVPVNIKDILDAPDEKLKIEDTEVHMVTFVGTLEKVETKQTNVTYTIQDDTGIIEVVQWIEGESPNPIGVMENNFCRVIGSVRHSSDRRHIMAFRVAPLTSANEITTHLLETMHAHLKLRQIKKKMGQPVATQFTGNNMGKMSGPLASSSTNFSAGGIPGLSNFQTMVYNIIQASTMETGIEKSQIYSSVKGKMNPRDVDGALEFLCSEGHIYSTVDEDHFKSTDS